MTTLRDVHASSPQLVEMMRRKRPDGVMVPVSVGDVVRMFEQGYAESMSWRKQTPITTREVVKVAMKRAA